MDLRSRTHPGRPAADAEAGLCGTAREREPGGRLHARAPRGAGAARRRGLLRARLSGFVLSRAAAALLAAAALAGAPAAAQEPAAGDAATDLLDLADRALAAGQLGKAKKRYDRALSARPDSVRALVGLGRVAQARREPDAARAHFEAALARDPNAVHALVGLADLEVAAGRPGRAREHLDRALEGGGARFGVHRRLARLTGAAPREALRDPTDPLKLAREHPYDPAALVLAAEHLATKGEAERAVALLEKALWLADLDPRAAARATELLPTLDAAWAGRRVVPVHAFADETFRAEPVWRFRLRSVWVAASVALEPLLQTRFVVLSMREFEAGDLSPVLDPIFERMVEASEEVPLKGIIAGFTGRPVPKVAGQWKRGLASFLGRHLIVRFRPPATRSRPLAHEILHLYGAVHVPEEVESLMNPAGGTFGADASNAAIVRALRERGFATGNFGRDVLSRIDLEETIAAYEVALKENLYLREAGLAEAVGKSRESRPAARRKAKQATQLDPQLADVSRMLARLMLMAERRVEALMLMELAAQLYGNTEKGRATAKQARVLMRELERRYGPSE